jgi:hypothetical protein
MNFYILNSGESGSEGSSNGSDENQQVSDNYHHYMYSHLLLVNNNLSYETTDTDMDTRHDTETERIFYGFQFSVEIS